jgi:hypothetical protein
MESAVVAILAVGCVLAARVQTFPLRDATGLSATKAKTAAVSYLKTTRASRSCRELTSRTE